VHQAVLGLLRHELHQALAFALAERAREARNAEVRRADGAHLAGPHETVERSQVFGRRRLLVVPVQPIEIDRLDAEAPQRILATFDDVVPAEALALLPHADLRRDDDVVAPAALLQPPADHGLALAALMAGHPVRIAVGRVDRIAAMRDEGVEDCERGRFVGRPAEHVAAQAKRRDGERRLAELALLHGRRAYHAGRPTWAPRRRAARGSNRTGRYELAADR
jgi:hypothetical protein